MKVRLDFVTNSSSSSYVIARRKDLTKEEVLEILSEKNLEEYMDHVRSGYVDMDDSKDYVLMPDDELKKEIAEAIASEVMHCGDIDLGEWVVSGGECSNDSGSVFLEFLYNDDLNGSPKLKFATSW